MCVCLCVCVKRDRGWRTFKRPGVEAFVQHMANYYEVVVYSDQLSMVSCFLIFVHVECDIFL